MKPLRKQTRLALLLLLISVGCSSQLPKEIGRMFPSFVEPTRTPFQPVGPTSTPTLTPTLTPVPVKEITLWLDPAIPPALRSQMHLPKGARVVKTADRANLQVGALRGGDQQKVNWVYALVAAFPNLTDELSLDEIQRAWRGEGGEVFTGQLMMSESTRAAFEQRWGPSAGERLRILPEGQLLDETWNNRSALAIIPFEDLQPRWKTLRVDGMSLFDKGLKLEDYPLTVWFGVTGQEEALNLLAQQLQQEQGHLLPGSNRDPNKMTVLVMTGVTALARATGYKMDTKGTTYPAQDIQDWLRNADLTHISNEVSFNEDCPKANFMDTSTMFCSRPEYIELLDFIGTDIVELSGNHNNDWGRAADSYSLELYQQRGWHIFAGGANLDEARTPLKLENNGNKLAFIGCNPAGPPNAWATTDEPGAAPCGDYGWLHDTIRSLRDEGYLPIVTFQYFELYIHNPSEGQERDFRAAADAGAVIISGSQAHFPQYMEFYKDTMIHYGLGNLFFDQMDVPVPGTRQEFVDRHVFYDGRYIQTELLTALLEDYAKPRPMTPDERNSFLSTIFSAAGW